MSECEEEANFKTAENIGDMLELPAMCVDAGQAKMYGAIEQKESGGIWVTVTKCNTDASDVECKGQAEIDEYISNLQFEVLYADNYLDLDDRS